MCREEACTVSVGVFLPRPRYSRATWRTIRSTIDRSMEAAEAVEIMLALPIRIPELS
jgi:hypothetical protein